MEKLLNPYDRQSMKMALLKHEETFKEQVFELHRVYQVQKMLMRNMKCSRAYRSEHEGWNSANKFSVSDTNSTQREPQEIMQRKLELERPTENGLLDIEDENEIELTLGPARYRRRKNNDKRILYSEVGPSVSSSSAESNFVERTSTIAQNRVDKREELTGQQQQWGLIQSFQSGKRGFEIDEQLKQERLNQPPWHFQVLSLNMT